MSSRERGRQVIDTFSIETANKLATARPAAHILSVATAVPPYIFEQTAVAIKVRDFFIDRFPQFDRVAGVFSTSGIEKRHAVRPLEWHDIEPGWPERTAAYLEGALAIFIDAAKKALDQAGLTGADVDTVVTVSSTGIATPTLEARAFDALGFRRDVKRVPVFGLGCAGGVTGLSVAHRLAEAAPGSRVLLVAVECCTLSLRADELTKANIVAMALFGDGGAACVLSTNARGSAGIGTISASSERLWPGTLDIMGWTVDPQGFGVIFDQSIPVFATEHLRGAVDEMLAEQSLTLKDITRVISHPGGRKVVEAIEQSLDLPELSLTAERDVLRDFGNMSAPTVLFVLEQVMAAKPSGRFMALALGPGFTLSSVTFESGSV